MPAVKTSKASSSTPQYHAADAFGNHIIFQIQRGTGNATLGSVSEFVVLSQQNAADLLAAFTQFATTGTLV
jgi:hypothetical protein